MNIFITGATGAIGKKLIKLLIDDNRWRIFCLVRNVNNVPDFFTNVEIVQGDMKDNFQIHTPIDIVVHIAAEVPGASNDKTPEKVKKYFEINSNGTKNLIDKAKNNGCKRFVYISSHAVIANQEKGIITDPYSLSKKKGEDAIVSSGLNWTILRPCGIYSDSKYWKKYFTSFKKKKIVKIIGNGNQLVQYICAVDVAKAIQKCLLNNNTYFKIYNIAGNTPITLIQYYSLIRKYTKKRFFIITVPLWITKIYFILKYLFNQSLKEKLASLNKNTHNHNVDIESAKRDFDFCPLEIEIGLKETLQSFNK